MRATSPPGSTIAARLVAVQATIEQFCCERRDRDDGDFQRLHGGFTRGRMPPHIVKPVLLREGLQRGLRPRAEMLDHLGGRERAEPRAVAMVLAARKPGHEPGGEQVARAGRIDELVDRRGRHRLVAFARDHDAALFAARHHRELHVVAQRRERGVEIGGLVQALAARASLAKTRSTAPVRIRLRNSSR